MPLAKLEDVELYYEETGVGIPLVWSHEFGGDFRSWEPQEPDLFNRHVAEFLASVEAARWAAGRS